MPVFIQMIENSETHNITLFVFLISLLLVAAIVISAITVSVKHHIEKRALKTPDRNQ